MAIFPKNHPDDVQKILGNLKNVPNDDAVVKVPGMEGPSCTLRDMLTSFYDINGFLSDLLIENIIPFMKSEKDKSLATKLVDDQEAFDSFKKVKLPRILDVFDIFPSIKIGAVNFVSQLEKIRPRW